MIRWCFFFLLLANAISLFWFAQQTEKAQVPVESGKENVQKIRLLNEMPPNSLKVRKARQDANGSESALLWCESLVGITKGATAQNLLAELRQMGIYVELHEHVIDVVQGYRIKARVPEVLDSRLSLMDYFEQNNVSVAESDPEPGLEVVWGYFSDEYGAQQVIKDLQLMSVEAVPISQLASEQRYEIAIIEQIDRKLSNKIKVLVKDKYSGIKIEKKVCEGVASIGSTE